MLCSEGGYVCTNVIQAAVGKGHPPAWTPPSPNTPWKSLEQQARPRPHRAVSSSGAPALQFQPRALLACRQSVQAAISAASPGGGGKVPLPSWTPRDSRPMQTTLRAGQTQGLQSSLTRLCLHACSPGYDAGSLSRGGWESASSLPVPPETSQPMQTTLSSRPDPGPAEHPHKAAPQPCNSSSGLCRQAVQAAMLAASPGGGGWAGPPPSCLPAWDGAGSRCCCCQPEPSSAWRPGRREGPSSRGGGKETPHTLQPRRPFGGAPPRPPHHSPTGGTSFSSSRRGGRRFSSSTRSAAAWAGGETRGKEGGGRKKKEDPRACALQGPGPERATHRASRRRPLPSRFLFPRLSLRARWQDGAPRRTKIQRQPRSEFQPRLGWAAGEAKGRRQPDAPLRRPAGA